MSITTTASGLVIEEVVQGTGAEATPASSSWSITPAG